MKLILISLIELAWLVVAPILGIIGFARAGAAMKEVRALRRQLDTDRPRSEPVTEPLPAVPQTAPLAPRPSPSPPSMSSEPMPVPPVFPAAAPPLPPRSTPPQTDLESIVTTRWAVWLGAVALLFAGVFLIRYAAEQGLLGPTMRCCAAAVLGSALLAGAEWLRRRDLPASGDSAPDQAPGALAAGGVAVLFGAAYGAGPYYDLVPPLVGFVGMAAASFLALLASLRFGPLTAAVGIVGAFASPALVAIASPSLAGLFAYLTVVTAAAHAVVRRTAWTWLGWAVTIAGASWVLVAASRPADPSLWAPRPSFRCPPCWDRCSRPPRWT